MNWPELVESILKTGVTQPQLAERCGCSQSTISELARGVTKEPRWSLGQALIRVAAEVSPEVAPEGREGA